MKKLLILFFLGCYSLLYGQNRIILQQSYFKEKFISLSKNKSIETFFPANTNQLNVAQLNRDSIPVYTDVEAYLYKRFPIEQKKKG